jgi:putative acetyltransferase
MTKFQRQGIGTMLTAHGLDWLRTQKEQMVFVLGPPEYYPRFGFSTDKARFIESPFNPNSFMALELKPHALEGIRGRVLYPAAFGL